MVKKVEYKGSFLTEYKKDIEGASKLLKRFSVDKELKESMVDALLYCSETAGDYYRDECESDKLTHYLLKIESKFEKSKRPLVWLCGFLSFKMIEQNKTNFKPIANTPDILSSDLSNLIGKKNYEDMFKKSKVKPDIFLSELIVLIEKQLDNGWRFSGCLGLSIERNICINNNRECFFCTDYDLSRENPGYINKGDQFCLFVGDLINNIEIFQYNKFKKNSPLSQNAIFYGKIVRMFASNLLESSVKSNDPKFDEYYQYAKDRALEVVEDDYFAPFVIKSFEDNVQKILTLSHNEILDGEYCDLGLLPVYSDFRNFYIELDMDTMMIEVVMK